MHSQSRKKATISFVVSVILRACLKQHASQPTDFCDVYAGKFYYNSVEKIEIGLILDKNIRQFTAILYCYLDEHR